LDDTTQIPVQAPEGNGRVYIRRDNRQVKNRNYMTILHVLDDEFLQKFERLTMNSYLEAQIHIQLTRKLHGLVGPKGINQRCDQTNACLAERPDRHAVTPLWPFPKQISSVLDQWIMRSDQALEYLQNETTCVLYEYWPKVLVELLVEYCRWFTRGKPGPPGSNGRLCRCIPLINTVPETNA